MTNQLFVVIGVVVSGGGWLLGSIVLLQQSGIGRGKRGSKATMSTHPKYSQARSYTTYVCIGIKGKGGYHMWTELQNAGIRGDS